MTLTNRALAVGTLGAAALALAAGPAQAVPSLQPVDSVAESFAAPKRLAAAVRAERAAQRPESQATIMVKLRDDSAAATTAFSERHGLTVVRRLPQIDWVELRAGGRVHGLLDALQADPDVLGTDALAEGERFGPDFTPRDPIFSGTFGDGTPYAWHMTKINLPAAWDITRGSSATTVGVIDSEFDSQNPDLQTKLKTGYNTKQGTAEYHTSNVRAANGESCNVVHGTHVAGIVAAATDNNKGSAGVSFDNLVLPVRSSFNFTTGAGATDAQFVADVTEAIIWAADKGIVAINMSFGTSRPHDPLRDAIAYAVGKGVTMVGSAGNDQQSSQGVINYPAAYPGVIAVAATKPNDDVAAFSTNGDYVDIAAPGDPVLSTWEGRCTEDGTGQFNNDGVQLKAISGTSMSAPIVAGVVGLMKSVRPDLSPAEVESLLTSTARDLGAGGRDPVFGAGIVDANKAVTAARAYVRPAPPAPPAPPPPPPVISAPPAIAPPTKTLRVIKTRGRASYNRKLARIAIRVECEIACRGSVRLKALDRTLKFRTSRRGKQRTRLSYSLQAGKRRTLKLYVSKRLMRRYAKLSTSRRVAVKITITGQGRGSQSRLKRTVRPNLTVRRP